MADKKTRRIIVGITAYNRKRYLQELINSFLNTHDKTLNWTIIVADDGSTDGTLEYLEKLVIEKIPIIIIKNSRVHISRQTNSILEVARQLDFDFGFMLNDDIVFIQAGWEHAYMNAYLKHGIDHLVHYNLRHRHARIRVIKDELVAYTDARHCMGCLWTFTPKLIKDVGFLDESRFIGAGHAHQEYTVRCCKAGFNHLQTVFDISSAQQKIKLYTLNNDRHYKSFKDLSRRKKNLENLEQTLHGKNPQYHHIEKTKTIVINHSCKLSIPEEFSNQNEISYISIR
jgi:glycosyltransferase involved in cell wall biosynthesis